MSSENATQLDAEESVVQEDVASLEENVSANQEENLQEDFDLSPRERAIEALVAKRHEQFEEESSVDLSSEEQEVEEVEQELEAEKRIDIIGQNGNDGLHYEEVDGES